MIDQPSTNYLRALPAKLQFFMLPGQQKTGAKKDPENEKRPLTNNCQWCKMEVHTVGVCRPHISPFNKVILPQNGAAVK